MPRAVSGLMQRLTRSISEFTVAQRTIAIIGVAGLILGSIALFSWLTKPTMTPLFSGLSASDANAVVEQLRSASVDYELTDGGSTILVPEGDVYDQRLVASSAGIPSASSDGYSLLDAVGVTTSEFQQSVTYKRAIEGELAATIRALDGVTTASVQLAIPEESVFVSEAVEPTASVFVETKEGVALSTQQVEAIVHLTSASISGMPASNVAVIDQSGRTLSAVGVGASGGVDQQASDYEARVAASIRSMLDTVVGVGNSTVTVSADIARSTSERLDETYTPAEGTPPASEQSSSETSTGGDTDAGVLGPDNIAVPDDTEGSSFESTQESRNNVINKTTETTSTPAGSLVSQSVSVAVNAGTATVSVAQLTDLVAAAAGIDEERGDIVTVELIAFSTADADAAQLALQTAKDAAATEQQTAMIAGIILAAAAALAITAIIVTLVVRRKRSAEAREFDELFGERPPALGALPSTETAVLGAAPTVPLEIDSPRLDFLDGEPEPEPEPEPAQVTLQRRRRELETLSRRDPQRTAELLRTLIEDGRPS